MMSIAEEDFELELRTLPGVLNVGMSYDEQGDVTSVTLVITGEGPGEIRTQATQIANQTRIFGLEPGARGRINTIYMMIYFLGGSLGSLFSTIAWAHWGWSGVCALGLGLLGLAALRHSTGVRDATA